MQFLYSKLLVKRNTLICMPKKVAHFTASGYHLYSLHMTNEILLFSEYLKIDG